ncbi:hypothetical protein LTR37_018318 [Vermiconidia calcicola]|uniref:Uncharacterized protein n=1 Tax=Vermiconidia calcicola TaxID=1690605 RepID=A0ACC3MIU0_9PEZI|nr:hypothetical protein LTR37_018318 [Vermiconidia calcicola]
MPSLRVGFVGGLVGVALGILGTLTTSPRGSTIVDSTTGISSLSQRHIIDDAGASYPGVITIHDEEEGTSPLPRITTSTSISGEQTGGDDRSTADYSGGDVTEATEIATSAPVAGVSGVLPLFSSMGGDAIIHSDIGQGAIHLLEKLPVWLRVLLLVLVLSPLVFWERIETFLRPATAPVLLVARSWLPAGLYSTLSNFSLVSLLWYNLGPLIDLAVELLLPGYSGPSDIAPKTLTALAAVLIVYFRTGRQDDVISQLTRERDEIHSKALSCGLAAKAAMNGVKQARAQIKQLQQALGRKRQLYHQTKSECRAAENRAGSYLDLAHTLLNALCLNHKALQASPAVFRAAEKAQAAVGKKRVMPHGPFGTRKVHTDSAMDWPEQLPYDEETLAPGLRDANFKLNRKILAMKKQLTVVGHHMAAQEDGHAEELKKKDNQISLLRKRASQHGDEVNEMVDRLENTQLELEATEQKVEEHLATIEKLQGQLGDSNAENTRLGKKIDHMEQRQSEANESYKQLNKQSTDYQEACAKVEKETNKKIHDLKAELKEEQRAAKQAREDRDAMESKLKARTKEVETLEQKLNGLEKNSEAAKNELETSVKKAERLEKERDALQSEMKSSAQKVLDLQKQLDTANKKLDANAKEIEALKKERDTLQGKLDRTQEELGALKKELDVVTEKLRKSEEEVEALKSAAGEAAKKTAPKTDKEIELETATKQPKPAAKPPMKNAGTQTDGDVVAQVPMGTGSSQTGQVAQVQKSAYTDKRTETESPQQKLNPATNMGTQTDGDPKPQSETFTAAEVAALKQEIQKLKLELADLEQISQDRNDELTEAQLTFIFAEGEVVDLKKELQAEQQANFQARTKGCVIESELDGVKCKLFKKETELAELEKSKVDMIEQHKAIINLLQEQHERQKGKAPAGSSTGTPGTGSAGGISAPQPSSGGNSTNDQTGPPLPKSSEYGRGFRSNAEDPVDTPETASNDIMAGRKVAKPRGAKKTRAVSAQDTADREWARENYFEVLNGFCDDLEGMDDDRIRRIHKWAKEREDEDELQEGLGVRSSRF